jgi:hypothetical protein
MMNRLRRLLARTAAWRPLLGLVLVLMLPACGGVATRINDAVEAEEQEKRAYPENHKADTIAFLRTYLNDPGQIREAGISSPTYRAFATENRYTVCIRYNPRRSSGGYAGSREQLVVFARGRLDRVVDARQGECKDVAYHPFPELERLTR